MPKRKAGRNSSKSAKRVKYRANKSALKKVFQRLNVLEHESKVDNPVIKGCFEDSQTITSNIGEQNWTNATVNLFSSRFIQMVHDYYQGVDSSSSDFSAGTTYKVDYASMTYNIYNPANYPCFVTAYLVVPKSDCNERPAQSLSDAIVNPANRTNVNTGTVSTHACFRLADQDNFFDQWKVIRKNRFMLNPMAVKTINVNRKNELLKMANLNVNDHKYLKNKSVCLLLSLRGAYSFDAVTNLATYSEARICIHQVGRIKFRHDVTYVPSAVTVKTTKMQPVDDDNGPIADMPKPAQTYIVEDGTNEDTVDNTIDGTDG